MDKKELKASILLTLAAMIWGLAFVAQRVGSRYVGYFTYTGIRFALGALSLLPLMYIKKKKEKNTSNEYTESDSGIDSKTLLKLGITAGFILFAAANLQHRGLEETTAGKAAFITGFYIILVPIFGIFLKQKPDAKTWISAVLALIGLYLISMQENFSISRGDFFVFLSSFFFAAHILLINQYAKSVDTMKLSFVQYSFCSIFSLIAAVIFEEIKISAILEAGIPILYGGIFSVGIAYTLQITGQKHAKAAHAAVIMSLEALFAVIGGALILDESMYIRGYIGCMFMIISVLVSQYQGKFSLGSGVSRKNQQYIEVEEEYKIY